MFQEETVLQEGVVMETIPENGVQRFGDIIIQQHNEDESSISLHLELEDSADVAVHEINMNQSVQLEEETVPDLEMAGSEIVRNVYKVTLESALGSNKNVIRL